MSKWFWYCVFILALAMILVIGYGALFDVKGSEVGQLMLRLLCSGALLLVGTLCDVVAAALQLQRSVVNTFGEYHVTM